MAPNTEDAGVLDQKRQHGSYAQSSNIASPSPASHPTSHPAEPAEPAEPAPAYQEAPEPAQGVPTIDSPFSFPAAPELPPSYEAHASEAQAAPGASPTAIKTKPPMAIPQIAPDPAAPFLAAYPPCLLAYGITEPTWRSFLDTLSAFLTATVSDRAIAHAADMAKSFGDAPRNYGKSLAGHTRRVGRQLATDARRFNVLGLAAGVVEGAISIPMHAAFGAVDAIFQMPGTAVSAVSRTPRTPLQRAATYSAVANRDWLHARGLHAVLADTNQLADMVHVPGDKFLGMAAEGGKGGKGGTAAGTMDALAGHVEKLKVLEDEVVVLSGRSLWLVLVPVLKEEEEEEEDKDTDTK